MAQVLIRPLSEDPRLKHLDGTFEDRRQQEQRPEYRTAQSLDVHFHFQNRELKLFFH